MKTQEIRKFYCGFVTGRDRYWPNLKLRLKYMLMRTQGSFYPDVYCIPFWLGAKCSFLADGTKIHLNKYEFIFSELNGGVEQLEYLSNVVDTCLEKVVVLPGPPEIFLSEVNDTVRDLARHILKEARHVWVYSKDVAAFVNKISEVNTAKVIPWPFDYSTTRRLGEKWRVDFREQIQVLIGAPLRFDGIAENAPHFLEDCIATVLAEIPEKERRRFKFHAFVYTRNDKALWDRTNFGKKVGVIFEPKISYRKFVNFIGNCDAVIQLSRFSVLGRLTFIAAVFEKPGIFTDNVELNRRLYPGSLVHLPTDEKLRDLVHELLLGLIGWQPIDRFIPDVGAAMEIGDFVGNANKIRELL